MATNITTTLVKFLKEVGFNSRKHMCIDVKKTNEF